MATDIAFAVGILALLGKRVPPALRVLLLALAVIDDLGAIVVIALFYSAGLSWAAFGVAAAGFVGILLMQRLGVRAKLAYLAPALLAWGGVCAAGVHPTIAGVVIGLITPVRAWLGREAVSPSESLIQSLHPWVAFGIMPVFALANAGVSVGGVAFDGASAAVATSVAAGLVLGKPIGVMLACLLAVRLGIARLPVGITTRHLVVLGVVAGVGFTMALFIAQLAFSDLRLLAAAKLGILIASAAAGLLALVLGRLLLPKTHDRAAAASADEAEASTAL